MDGCRLMDRCVSHLAVWWTGFTHCGSRVGSEGVREGELRRLVPRSQGSEERGVARHAASSRYKVIVILLLCFDVSCMDEKTLLIVIMFCIFANRTDVSLDWE